MYRTLILLVACVMWYALPGVPLHAAPLYQLTVIGGAGSAASGLNSTGQVVGSMAVAGQVHGFFHDGSALIDLGTLGGDRSVASGLNDRGMIVGGSVTSVGIYQAFVYANGTMTGLPFTTPSAASGINNAGVIVGTFGVADGPEPPPGYFYQRAFTYAHGVVTNLGLLPGTNGLASYGAGINDAGVTVGSVEVDTAPDYPRDAFVYKDGVMQSLGNFGGQSSDAYAINDLGQIAGSAGVATTPTRPNVYAYHAFLYSSGLLQDLGAITESGNSVAYALNNLGQAVGSADTVRGSDTRAVLYENGSILQLDKLIDPVEGWAMTVATGINDAHQIVGTACREGLCYAVRLDLAAAIPEPAHASMLLAGLFILVGAHGVRSASKKSNVKTKKQ